MAAFGRPPTRRPRENAQRSARRSRRQGSRNGQPLDTGFSNGATPIQSSYTRCVHTKCSDAALPMNQEKHLVATAQLSRDGGAQRARPLIDIQNVSKTY